MPFAHINDSERGHYWITWKKPNMKTKSWAALLHEESQKQVREPEGKGWQTFSEIHESLGQGEGKTRRVIKESAHSGKCEVFRGTQKTADGRFSMQVWYRLK